MWKRGFLYESERGGSQLGSLNSEIVVNKLELKFMNRDADLTNEDVALYLLSCTWSRKLNNVKYFDTKDPELLSRYSFLFSGAKSVYILGRWEALPIESILGES